MKVFLLNVLLSVAWGALLGDFSPVNMLAGFAFGYMMLWVTQDVLGTSNYFTKVRRITSLIGIFTKELIKSNLRVAWSVLTPFDRMSPGIVAIPLDIESDAEITLLANMITLTPGTLSLDVSDDRRVLYVHGMHVGDDIEAFRQDIKSGFEKKVREAFE
jgi:multicomponent Na+:H+ antiporter subunit E